MTTPAKRPQQSPLFEVHDSPIHGKGVFARREIPAGTRIMEYTGEIVDWIKDE